MKKSIAMTGLTLAAAVALAACSQHAQNESAEAGNAIAADASATTSNAVDDVSAATDGALNSASATMDNSDVSMDRTGDRISQSADRAGRAISNGADAAADKTGAMLQNAGSAMRDPR